MSERIIQNETGSQVPMYINDEMQTEEGQKRKREGITKAVTHTKRVPKTPRVQKGKEQ